VILEILDDHGRPLRIVASRVVIREATTQTPVAVAADFADRGIMAGVAGDADFEVLLRVTGVQDSVLVTHMTPEQLRVPGIR
jgi:hypothetical protein